MVNLFMQTSTTTVHELFTGENEYRSPLFQRHYVWKQKQLDELWDDIDKVLDGVNQTAFLGALVFKEYQSRTSEQPNGYTIIDGQQRLTTFYLLLLAGVSVSIDAGFEDIANDYTTAYLLSRQRIYEGKPKLYPTIPDLAQFKDLLTVIEQFHPVLTESSITEEEGTLINVFLLHQENLESRIKNTEGEIDKSILKEILEDILNKIEFCAIYLSEHQDANEVFQRLNVTGEPLNIIDLIRNEVFSLMKDISGQESQTLYNNQWMPFENSFSQGSSGDEKKKTLKLINHYWLPFTTIKDKTITSARVYSFLSQNWASEIQQLKDESETEFNAVDQAKHIIKDCNTYVKPYLAFSIPDRPDGIDDEFWKHVTNLHEMKLPLTFSPYLMCLLKEIIDNNGDQSEGSKCLKFIESFLVRRAFYGLEATGLQKVLKDLWITAGSDVNKIINVINDSTIVCPDDETFKKTIGTAEIYRRKLCAYIVKQYELSLSSDVTIEMNIETIDHVMPQNRIGDWKTNISEDDHTKFKHVWGNLAPLSRKLNSEKSDNNWDQVKNWLARESIFPSTKQIVEDNSSWGIEQIEDRTEILKPWALNRWPLDFN